MLKIKYYMGLFGDIMKSLGSAFTGDPLGSLGSLISIGTSIGGTKRSKKLMDYQDRINDANYERERQDKLADYQMQLNDQRQLIDEERRYTSIGSVMQRARDANVSPLAALGVSSGNTLASVSPPQGTSSQGVSQAPDTSASRGQAVMSAISTLQDMKIQRENLQIEKDLAQAEIDKKNAETKSINERLPFISQEAQETVNNLIKDGKYKEAQEVLAKAEIALKEQEHEQKEEMFPLLKSSTKSDTDYKKSMRVYQDLKNDYIEKNGREMSKGMDDVLSSLFENVFGDEKRLDALLGHDEYGQQSFISYFNHKVHDTKSVAEILSFFGSLPQNGFKDIIIPLIVRAVEQREKGK